MQWKYKLQYTNHINYICTQASNYTTKITAQMMLFNFISVFFLIFKMT